jgi:hypothetical protein
MVLGAVMEKAQRIIGGRMVTGEPYGVRRWKSSINKKAVEVKLLFQ